MLHHLSCRVKIGKQLSCSATSDHWEVPISDGLDFKYTLRINRNRPFPSSPKPLFQSEFKCEAIGMKIIFHFHANKTHFKKRGFALSQVLKATVLGTRKWHFFFCMR